ncbi:MAG: ABC transporter ATP-binding protein [Nitrospirae bacterium]|nr:ABC transporter ATP-binding protein [Nitrospirota bacterium]
MSEVVIRAENLFKEYRLGTISHGTLYRDLQSWWARLRNKEDPNSIIASPQSFTPHASRFTSSENPHMLALNNVSFEVKRGEVLGIIGKNGAGKSTLLKILSEVTSPTKGQVKIKGRVASLLEVGTGFHPELTGRENIYLNGAILGMTKKEIADKFEEIVAFAEIEKFIDTPVKRYSSGMYVRLAFAVAAHLEPEILIIDEVLAVGDAAFQKKCLGKMGEVSKEGRTVLFVSHNMTAIKTLCERVIWLEAGQIADDGYAAEVVSHYLLRGSQSVYDQLWPDRTTAPGNDKVRLRRARIMPETATGKSELTVMTPLTLEFECWSLMPSAELNFSMHLYNEEGLCILADGSESMIIGKELFKGTCRVPGKLLNEGSYRVMIMVVRDGMSIYTHHDLLRFDVHDIERQGGWTGRWPGVVRPKFAWNITSLPEKRI